MESHAELKDKCDGLETRLDEIAADIRDLPFNYKLVEKYHSIDEDVQKLYEWYDSMKNSSSDILKKRSSLNRNFVNWTKKQSSSIMMCKTSNYKSFLVSNTELRIHNYIITSILEILTESNIFEHISLNIFPSSPSISISG